MVRVFRGLLIGLGAVTLAILATVGMGLLLNWWYALSL